MNANKQTQIYIKSFANKLRIKMVNEEFLAGTFTKYTVLYDKSRADFKDRTKKLLAWNDVARTVGLTDDMKTFRNYKDIK